MRPTTTLLALTPTVHLIRSAFFVLALVLTPRCSWAEPPIGWICQGELAETFLEDRFDDHGGDVEVEVIDDDCRGVASEDGWIEVDVDKNWPQLDFEILVNLDSLFIPVNEEVVVFELYRPGGTVVVLTIRQEEPRERLLLADWWTDGFGGGGRIELGNVAAGDHRFQVTWIGERTLGDGELRFAIDGEQVAALTNLAMSSMSRPIGGRLGMLAKDGGVNGELSFRPTFFTWHLVPPPVSVDP